MGDADFNGVYDRTNYGSNSYSSITNSTPFYKKTSFFVVVGIVLLSILVIGILLVMGKSSPATNPIDPSDPSGGISLSRLVSNRNGTQIQINYLVTEVKEGGILSQDTHMIIYVDEFTGSFRMDIINSEGGTHSFYNLDGSDYFCISPDQCLKSPSASPFVNQFRDIDMAILHYPEDFTYSETRRIVKVDANCFVHNGGMNEEVCVSPGGWILSSKFNVPGTSLKAGYEATYIGRPTLDDFALPSPAKDLQGM